MSPDLSTQIMERYEKEAMSQRHLAREIHDTVANHFVSANLLLGRLKDNAMDAEIRRSLDELNGELEQALRDLRSFCFLLDVPDDFDSHWASNLRTVLRGFTDRAGLRLSYDNRVEQAHLGSVLRTVVLRILQEALVNIARHARARSVSVILAVAGPSLQLEISDDGVGFASSARQGVGLRSMSARAREIGGEFSIASTTRGTIVRTLLPLA